MSLSGVAPAPFITLSWLVRMRWAAVAGQLLTIGVVRLGIGMPLPVVPLVAIVGLTVLSNLVLEWRLKAPEEPSSRVVAAVIVSDTLLLTALLFFSGGPSNPFAVLYLLHVALAVVLLGTRWGFVLVGLSALCFALLYARSVPLSGLGEPSSTSLSLHLGGTWLAFLVAAGFVTYFLGRISAELRSREQQLMDVRAQVARDEKLASLSTLAAGAAHELGTPLATIAVIARELERSAKRLGEAGVEEDARLIRKEVDRCRTILLQMSGKAGESAGELPSVVPVRELVGDVRSGLPSERAARLRLDVPPALHAVTVPRQALALVLGSLARNAFDASDADATVELSIVEDEAVTRFTVSDRGEGMAEEVLARAGEPFFTTKPEGAGTGLGLFLARALAERLGGRLDIESHLGVGTKVTITLPRVYGTGTSA